MGSSKRRRLPWLMAVVAIAIGQPAISHAKANGIVSNVFGPAGCPLCHSGGTPPNVVLSGPSTVAPGGTADYTLTIFGNPSQRFGGLNVVADGGVLSTGGPFATGTQALSGLGGRAEITHTTPKQGDLTNIVEFSFRWTAPPAFVGTVHLRGWGNSVNGDNATSGDAAALATLDVISNAPSPTPTATPTPGPDLCGDVAPSDPALVSASAGQACEKAVAKAGSLYVKKGLKAAQTCLKTLQASGVATEPIALCAGSSAAVLPTDAKAGGALAKAAAKLRAQITGKCDDATVAALGLCAATATGLGDCVLAAHHQAIVDAIGSQYGSLQPTADPDSRRCQGAIGKSAAGFLSAYLKASGKCLDARNKNGTAGSGAALCIGSVSGGGFVPPTGGGVADALQKATGKVAAKVSSSCTETDVASLDACAGNKSDLITCLICAQRGIAFQLLGAQYGGN